MSYQVMFKRIYAPDADEDGARVLVDRLWPRGKKRNELALQEWYQEAAPGSALRRQYHQGKITRSEFSERYIRELANNPDKLLPLMRYAREGRLTLLTAAREVENSHLPVLKAAVLQALEKEDAEDNELSSPPCWAHTL